MQTQMTSKPRLNRLFKGETPLSLWFNPCQWTQSNVYTSHKFSLIHTKLQATDIHDGKFTRWSQNPDLLWCYKANAAEEEAKIWVYVAVHIRACKVSPVQPINCHFTCIIQNTRTVLKRYKIVSLWDNFLSKTNCSSKSVSELIINLLQQGGFVLHFLFMRRRSAFKEKKLFAWSTLWKHTETTSAADFEDHCTRSEGRTHDFITLQQVGQYVCIPSLHVLQQTISQKVRKYS